MEKLYTDFWFLTNEIKLLIFLNYFVFVQGVIWAKHTTNDFKL